MSKIDLKGSDYIDYSIVLSGSFNPSIVDKTWMVHNNILNLSEATSLKDYGFSKDKVAFKSLYFTFVCTTDKMTIQIDQVEFIEIGENFLKSVLSLLNHTKIRRVVLGYNGHFNLSETKISLLFDKFRTPFLDNLAKVEDYNYWTNLGDLFRIGRCPSSDENIHIQVFRYEDLTGNDSSTKGIEFLEENFEFKTLGYDLIHSMYNQIESQTDNNASL